MKILARATLSISILAAVVMAQNGEAVTDAMDGGCSICAVGEEVTLPDTIVRENTAGFTLPDQTCEEIQDLATSGSYTYYQCNLLDNSAIGETCGCAEPEEAEPETELTNGGDGDDTSGAEAGFYKRIVITAASVVVLMLN